jgi:hypothetical protein
MCFKSICYRFSVLWESRLAKLTDQERAAFKQLWKEVDGLLTRAEGSK